MNYAQLMKTAILADLQTLVNAGTLNCIVATNYTKMNPLDWDYPGFPAAIVWPPTVRKSDFEDQATNAREYEWTISVVDKSENVQGAFKSGNTHYLEDLIDAVLNVFDLDCTLQGSAVGAVE